MTLNEIQKRTEKLYENINSENTEDQLKSLKLKLYNHGSILFSNNKDAILKYQLISNQLNYLEHLVSKQKTYNTEMDFLNTEETDWASE